MSASTGSSDDAPRGLKAGRLLRTLGPGLITGASDDDPSGIGTYSQAGAQLGYGIGWTMFLTFPLMASVQEISARIGRTTGYGIGGNLCRHYPTWLVRSIVICVFAANAINIGADLGAMGDAMRLIVGGPTIAYVLAFGLLCVVVPIFLDYGRYVSVLKWLTLSLFAYVAALFASHVDWGAALKGVLVPHIEWTGAFFTTLVAIMGTTISPYLFFWQASQEAEDVKASPRRKALLRAPRQAAKAFERIRADTLVGMAFSNIIALAIIITTAATLHQNGVTNIESSVQAAEALKPVAGPFAFAIFALGIVATGLLAIPVLAGSAAYALAEGSKWPIGLGRQPADAVGFYGALAVAIVIGMGLNMTSIDPIKALYWSAVINGMAAVPVLIVLMLMTGTRKVMGDFVINGWLRLLGWATTTVMALCAAGMIVSLAG